MGCAMDFDALSARERHDALAEIADLYFIQQKTRVEIAEQLGISRFKVAKLLQDARDEKVVEIKVNYSNERSSQLERQLVEAFGLNTAVVVNTKYSTQVESMGQVGEAGAAYVDGLLTPDSTLGLTWGKTIQPIVDMLPQTARKPISVVQITGCFELPRVSSESQTLVKHAAATYFGTAYPLNAPLYLKDESVRERFMQEPDIVRTLDAARHLDVVLTGIGGTMGMPLGNVAFDAYLTESDRAAAATCSGSIYGFVLDAEGNIADIDLNRRLVSVPIDDVMRCPHRIGVITGRYKAPVAALVAKSGLINEIITTSEAASRLLMLV